MSYSSGGSDADPTDIPLNLREEEIFRERKPSMLADADRKLVQGIREVAVIKILENGVRLNLKLQTSHIASMYFETWLDRKKQSTSDPMVGGDGKQSWLEWVRRMKEKDLRSYLDLVTLTCVLVAAKVNE